ncbi:acetylglutamate kinase [Streptomyces asoensis]|uniref:Acetylglutamate kinase n=2 Tax=Streptomyces asoensis TaxID=249586 RepID=C1IC23_9ACTN|nr:acetylglutamate kinase [Streptomyces asoensis]ABX24488.1 acetylglutamate kinase [Streptomyces asoensis]GGQ54472.1 acetylglutamate kinase [Streptomyces asoensis]GHI60757.1 acetylglutamate kinase [Streptomyces asoensis]
MSTAPAAPARPLAGRTVLIKCGGSVLDEGDAGRTFAEDVAELADAGTRVVVVHGGGPQIDTHLERLGIQPVFRHGLRVTTPPTMEVVRMVLSGQVQRRLVGLLNRERRLAVGLTGEDARTFTAADRQVFHGGQRVDLGLVGDIVDVDDRLLRTLLDAGLVPVVSSIARSADGSGVRNVNADLAAAALAAALRADTLLLLTDVAGLYPGQPDRGEVLDRLTAAEADALLPRLTGGMIPKVQACSQAVRAGVATARIADGRIPHAVREHLLTGRRTGTTVSP